jgi:dTDP-4-dehydrorhamnose 3,5-epimerase
MSLEGSYLIELERREDDRGFFARAWCEREFAAHGLNTRLVQANVAWSRQKGTLRGLHFQRPPHAEAKVVRCTKGAIYDVIVDLRPGSPTQKQWLGVKLSADNRRMVYVPEGFAHGYQTLVDDTETFYHVSEFYTPAAEGGVRWDDPAFGIEWPDSVGVLLSEKDRTWPDYGG